jgi:trigger factor
LDEKAELTDEFAKSMGFPSLEDFKKAMKRNLEFDKERQNRQDVENQLIEQLLKTSTLHVPRSLAEKQLEGRIEDFRQRMKQYGAKDEDIAKRLTEVEKDIKAAAEKDVQLFLILQKIGQEEKIEAKQGESIAAKVMEFLLKEAKWEEAK